MKLPFEKIYCIHLAEDVERYELLMNELRRIGIEDQVDIWWTSKKNINTIIGNSMTSLHTQYYDEIKESICPNVYQGVFDCTYNHYSIISQAYARGLKSILIFEDDIIFNDDVEKIKAVFDSIPDDYTIVKFHNVWVCGEYALCKNPIKENLSYDVPKFITYDDESFMTYGNSLLCYGMTHDGMKHILDAYDRGFQASDIVVERVKKLDKPQGFYTLASNMLCMQRNVVSNIINAYYT